VATDTRTQQPQAESSKKQDAKEYVIDRICEEAKDDEGDTLFRVRWFNFGPKDDTWEPEDILPPPLVAAFRKAQKKKAARQTRRSRRHVKFSNIR